MKIHKWQRHLLKMGGNWQGYKTTIQVWKCENCKEERERPDDDSQPALNNCKG